MCLTIGMSPLRTLRNLIAVEQKVDQYTITIDTTITKTSIKVLGKWRRFPSIGWKGNGHYNDSIDWVSCTLKDKQGGELFYDSVGEVGNAMLRCLESKAHPNI